MKNKVLKNVINSLLKAKAFYISAFLVLCVGGSLQAELVPELFKDAYVKYTTFKEVFFGVVLPIIGVAGSALRIGQLYISHKYLMIVPCVIAGVFCVYIETIIDALFAVKSVLIG